MYIQEIAISIKPEADRDEVYEAFCLLLSFYRGSGQTQGKLESQYFEGNKILCLPYTLEKDSLDPKFNNHYVNRQIGTVEGLCGSKLQFKTLGKLYECYDGPCSCKKPGFYILTTNYISFSSPLTCGSCYRHVPLYRLPVYYDHGFMPILSWESNYNACDQLQMNGEVGERWALNQMQEITSQLSKQGRNICSKIEELTSIPTYYYLHNYNKYKGPSASRPCPVCNQPWELKTPLHDHYDYQCTTCRLVSTVSICS